AGRSATAPWPRCGPGTAPGTRRAGSCDSRAPGARTSASWSRCSGDEATLAVARAAAQVAHRAPTAPRGALARRPRQARHPHGRLTRVLGLRLRSAVSDPQVLPRRGGAGTAPRGEAVGPGAADVHRHPGAVERHHRAIVLLSGEGPGPARLGARGLAAGLPREAARDAAPLVVDGGADGRPDPRGVRRGLARRGAVRAIRRSHVG